MFFLWHFILKYKKLQLIQLQISRSHVKTFIYVPSLSSLLLLRDSPNPFAFIPLLSMSLSSLNRSNSKAFRHIMPYSAPVCEGIHYHKTGVPWQMNNTLIINFSCSEMPCNAEFCVDLSAFPGILFFLLMTTLFCKILQDGAIQSNV